MIIKTGIESKSIIQRKIFSENFAVALVEELSCVGAGLVDGLIISIALGSTAMAAEGMIHPIFSVTGIISGAMLLGIKKLCTSLMCKNEKEEAQEIYSAAVLFALGISLLIAALCIIFSGNIISFLGIKDKGSQLFRDAKAYLLGLSFGVPFLILVPVVTPAMQLSGRKTTIKLSLVAIMVLDILFDVLAVVLSLGMLGIGLGTSLAQLIGFIILIFPTKQVPALRVKLSRVHFGHLKRIVKEGMPNIVRRLCNVIKPITVNRLLMIFAGSCGMTAMSVRNSISSFAACIGAAVGAAVLTLTVVFAAEHNGKLLKNLKSRAFRYVLAVVIPSAVLLFVFSSRIAAVYVRDDALALAYAVEAIRFMAIDLVLMAVMAILMGYWQGIGYTKEINRIIILEKLLYPLISVVICYLIFGIRGVWISFPISTMLTIITFGIISCIKTKKLILLPIPDDCSIAETQMLECVVRDIDEISRDAQDIQQFSINAGVNARDSQYIALCFEETACVILQRGCAKNENEKAFDCFISVTDDKVVMRFRDNCIGFKAVSRFDMFTYDYEHPENHLGTRIIMSRAKKIEWVSTFGFNNLIVEF